ncbi:MAG: excinuclease ABC subunit A [Chloroflexi bacterium RBG_13_68_17]|nr:MAG: excinuclease ABC subunit A [Chloroflexi bacterium RBG_13_68_17]
MADPDFIVIRGAREHNLKSIDLRIPRRKLVVFTGVSGSGKSSLAFDTLYAEGQRRYVESLSAYARQFLGQMEKPRVDFIGGLSPAIAIEQKAVSKNPRSTVGTVTEISDYLRVLFARLGTPYCYNCGRRVSAQTSTQIVDQLLSLRGGTRFLLLAPVARKRKGTHEDTLGAARAAGFVRARVDGIVVDLSEKLKLAKNKKHDIEIVVDRLTVPPQIDEAARRDFRARLADSVETALRSGGGALVASVVDGPEMEMSERHACPHCGISFPEFSPPMFSFNSPLGMCPECNGLGVKLEFDPAKFVDPEKSLREGAVRSWGSLTTSKGARVVAQAFVKAYAVDLDMPWKRLPKAVRDGILFGSKKVKVRWEWGSDHGQGSWESTYEGTINATRRRFHQTKSEGMREWYGRFMSNRPCPTCGGNRLRPEATSVRFGGRTIVEISALSIVEAQAFFSTLQLDERQLAIGEEVLKEIRERLTFLLNVGLHYLTLDRAAPSLSGGEGQRIRLASQIGSGLTGVMYCLDEPSIGLHQRDNRRLLDSLLRLRDLGNTVVVVEHDRETIDSADYVVDFGPGAGARGGKIVASGTPVQIRRSSASLTGRYLRGDLIVAAGNGTGNGRRKPDGRWLTVVGARHNNLKDVTVRFPIGLFTCVTGVSGSGKSSLIAETLHPALAAALHGAEEEAGDHDEIDGLEHIDKVINITQDPIGRTPRSNPATYVGAYGPIRDLFALTPEARARGYRPGRFSFNVKGGRCEVCEGHGQKRIEMHFLADVWVICQECRGTRFNHETLQVRYKGRNIAEVLEMEVGEALAFFENVPALRRILETLHEVGLDYIKLGQPATTLSGGEAQRVKLSRELARVATGRTLYILDEPTTGLHFADIQRLLDVLHRLTDAGNTVVVIEHNLDVVKTADWVIDLGPEGGDAGGRVIATGSPENLARARRSHTARYLQEALRPPTAGRSKSARSAAPASRTRQARRGSTRGG